MKKFASTWILAALVFAFVGYVYFYEYKGAGERQEPELASKRVLKAKPEDVVKITFVKGDNTFVVQKQDNAWRVVAPVSDLADADKISELTNQLTSERYQVEVTEKGQSIDKQVYGLELPLGTITLDLADGKQQSVVLGSRSAFGDGVYLKSSENEPVILGNSVWRELLITRLFELRDKELYTGDLAASLEVKVEIKGQPSFTLTQEKGVWSVLEHPSWVLDQTRVKSLMSDLASLRASDIVNEDKSSAEAQKLYGRVQAKVVVKQGANKGEWALQMTSPKDGKVFLSTTEKKPVYQIAEAEFKKLVHPLPYYRNQEVPFAYEVAPVVRLDLELGQQTHRLLKKDEKWVVEPEEEKLEVDQEKVKSLLSKIKSLRVAEYPELGKNLRFAGPPKNLRMLDKEGREVYRLTWGEAPPSSSIPPAPKADPHGAAARVLAQTSLSGDIFWLDAKAIEGLALSDLVKAKPQPPGAGQTEPAKGQ